MSKNGACSAGLAFRSDLSRFAALNSSTYTTIIMEHEFNGTVVKGDKTLFKEVKGVYEIDEFMQTWSGSFDILSGELPNLEDDGVLVMDDGKKGEIVITRIRLGTEIVEFQGVGKANFGDSLS